MRAREERKETCGNAPKKDSSAGAGRGVKGHDEGIENKWVRDSAIFRWCRVFRPGDSALSSTPRFHRSPIPSSSLVFIPRRFLVSPLRFSHPPASTRGASCRPSLLSAPPPSLPLPFVLKAWSSNLVLAYLGKASSAGALSL